MINIFVSAINCIVFIFWGCHNVLMGLFLIFCGCFSYIPTRLDKPWAAPSQAHWQRNGRSLTLGLRTHVFSLGTDSLCADLLNAKKLVQWLSCWALLLFYKYVASWVLDDILLHALGPGLIKEYLFCHHCVSEWAIAMSHHTSRVFLGFFSHPIFSCSKKGIFCLVVLIPFLLLL